MRMILSFSVAVFCWAAFASNATAVIDQREDDVQTPETLCQCSGNDSPSKGGIQTFAEYEAKFGADFKDRAELQLAWKVYQAVNRCDAVVVIGRLADTKSYRYQPGYCVLRKLENWTMRVNKAFVRGATDRGARIQLVSEMPPETMSGDVDSNNIRSEDRETSWIVIYNNEIQWVLASGHYTLNYDKEKKITPMEPAYLEPGPKVASEPGQLELVEVKPDPPCSTWDIYTTCDEKAGQIAAKSTWGSANYRWTPPPRQVGAEGFTVNLQVSQQTPPDNPIATGLNINGGGLDIDPPNATLPCGAKEGLNRSLSVHLKPPKNATGDYYLKIGVYWGPGFTYHYRAPASAK